MPSIPDGSVNNVHQTANAFAAKLEALTGWRPVVLPLLITNGEYRPLVQWKHDGWDEAKWAEANAYGVRCDGPLTVLDLDTKESATKAKQMGLLDDGLVVRTAGGGFHIYLMGDDPAMSCHGQSDGYDWRGHNRDGVGIGFVVGPGCRRTTETSGTKQPGTWKPHRQYKHPLMLTTDIVDAFPLNGTGNSSGAGTARLTDKVVEVADFVKAEYGITLVQRSNQYEGPCPLCGGSDRFRVLDLGGRLVIKCRKCTDPNEPYKTVMAAFDARMDADQMDSEWLRSKVEPLRRRTDAADDDLGVPAHLASAGRPALLWDAPPELVPILGVDDGPTLVAAGLIHWVYGHAGTGKTWFAALAASKCLASGGRVAWYNFDTTARQLGERLGLVGVKRAITEGDERSLIYFNSWESNRVHIAEWLAAADGPALVVVDTCEKSGCPDDGSSIREWRDSYLHPFMAQRDEGVALLLIDHQAQSEDSRGPKGNLAKEADSDRMFKTSGDGWTRTEAGRFYVTCTKDREGLLVANEPAATITKWTDQNGGIHVGVEPPQDPWQAKITDVLEQWSGAEPPTRTELLEAVDGRQAHKVKALLDGEAAGWFVVTRAGAGKPNRYSLPD